MPTVELSAAELKVLHSALEAFIESGSSGNLDCECRLLFDRVHNILSWGTGSHLAHVCRHSAQQMKTIRILNDVP
jgi:hypothetical protein